MYHSVVKVKKTLGPEFFKIKLQLKFNLQYGVLGKYKLCPCSTYLLFVCNNMCLYFQKSSDMHPGYKRVRGQSEAALQIGMCDQKL